MKDEKQNQHELSGLGYKPSPAVGVEDAILSAVQDDMELNMLIVGASPVRGGRHMHITTLVKELGDKLMIPLVIVPGNLTDKQIEELA